MNILIVLNLGLFIGATIITWDVSSLGKWFRAINTLTLMFLLELSMKNVAFGIKGFWRRGWNAFAGIIVIISATAQVVSLILHEDNTVVAVRVMFALSALTMLRVFTILKKIRQVVETLSRAFPVTFWTFLLIFAIVYSFAAIGMEGLANQTTTFTQANFSTFPESLLIVFIGSFIFFFFLLSSLTSSDPNSLCWSSLG